MKASTKTTDNIRKNREIKIFAFFYLFFLTSPTFSISFRPFGAQVAQSVEQGTENPRVGSSILSLGTTFLILFPTSFLRF